MSSDPVTAWLARVRHDLVKRLLWPARDRQALGGAVLPGELAPALVDDEGAPITGPDLWSSLRESAPSGATPVPTQTEALDQFGAAVSAACAAATRGDLAGLLALESAFDRLSAALARNVNRPGGR